MSLPNFVARCPGVGDEEDGSWRQGCEDCLRRTDLGTGDHVNHMLPPPIIAFWCEYYIAPGVSEIFKPQTPNADEESDG